MTKDKPWIVEKCPICGDTDIWKGEVAPWIADTFQIDIWHCNNPIHIQYLLENDDYTREFMEKLGCSLDELRDAFVKTQGFYWDVPMKGSKPRNTRTIRRKMVVDDIDRPIRDVVKRLNALGYETKFSCCGYKYPRQRGRKVHGWPYVTFYASFNKVRKLLDLVKKTETRVWSVDYEGGSTRRSYWKLYHFPVYIFPRGKKYTDQCKIAWGQIREILDKL